MARGRSGSGQRSGRSKPSNPYRKPDRFTQQAKDEGYAARSVYKLTEIQKRFRVLAQNQRVVDLGCSPGSWLAYVAQVVGGRGLVVGVDINEPKVQPGPILVKSVLEVTAEELMEALGGERAQVLLSDMAPLTTGNTDADHYAQIELATRAFELALEVLAPGGAFVCKVFDGEDAHAFVQRVRASFTETRRVRPEAVRQNSREFFVVAKGFTG
ncbi:MAG: RlmE family RNA methyltransferase [Myxococcales bacterium]|nr:RlmE family RNA methyltransferase [Myxococcales bacterium]